MIIACIACGPDHPVAGDEKGHGILTDGGAHCPKSAGIADGTGNRSIGREPAHRDTQQRLPYLQLKGGTLQVQLHFREAMPILRKDIQRILLNEVHSLLIPCMWKLYFQLRQRCLSVGDKGEVTDTFWRGGYNDLSERAFCKRVIDGERFPSIFILSRCHPLDADEQVMQAAGA